MLGVDHCILDKFLNKYLQDRANFVIDEVGHTHDACTPGKPTDGLFTDFLEIIA